MARSRRTTPQAQVERPVATIAPAATAPATRGTRARSTRSQSRDFPVAATQPAPTRKGRNLRQASVESASSVEGRPSRGQRRNVRDAAAVRDLTTVEEDPASEEEEPEAVPHAEDASTPPRNFRGEPQSPGAISGTTAISALSDYDAANLDREAMITGLVALYTSSEDLIRVAAPPKHNPSRLRDHIQEIKKPDSSVANRLNKNERSFVNNKNDYGDNSGSSAGYIDAQTVMKSIYGLQSLPSRDSHAWRLIEILQTANLAWLAKWIVSADRDSSATWDRMRNLDHMFPRDFLYTLYQSSQRGASPSRVAGSSALITETFRVALEIRTQVAILAFTRNYQRDDFDAEQTIRNSFYNTDATDNDTLRAWDVNGLGSGDLGLLPEFDQEMQKRVSDFRNTFRRDADAIASGASEELQNLQADFPWSGFAVRVLEWVRRRHGELSISIEQKGGAGGIAGSIKDEFELDNSLLVTQATPYPKSATTTISRGDASAKKRSRRSPISVKAIRDAKKRVSAAAASAKENVTQEPVEPDLEPLLEPEVEIEENGVTTRQDRPDDDWQQIDDNEIVDEMESEVVQPRLSQAAQNLINKGKANKENVSVTQKASQPKQRRFIDPQPDAQRIEFDSGGEGGSQQIPAKRRIDKRALPADIKEQDEDDVSEEEGFERDNRQASAADRRRAETSSTARRAGKQRARLSPKRARTEHLESSAPHDHDFQDDSTSGDDLGRRTQSNIRQSTQYAIRPAKSMQKRKGWTLEQETALLDYIEEYGTSWAQIKAIDAGTQDEDDTEDVGDGPNLLHGRDQVALKDKARNMRFAFHKSRTRLPRHFENVTLTKQQKRTLDALQIPYV
ncbi:hypothetical protein EJ08DRAFT_733424 [Tothia fuscella]|uniref:Myb-like domain-containing protein n=1 Tax=Tothia fuscella TaxID=1048955 RepID=A0A9P4NT38_9PEZI|nr:hypothetical protein EJ08DRAFT_733424 [Tothia fuscella]